MRIAISTPTGNVGNAAARRLLASGHQLVLLARSSEKVKDLAEQGARVEQGSLDDQAFVTRATAGSEALLWVTPADYTAEDFRASQNAFGKVAAAAVTANGIPRVVNISSIGAQLESGTGPIAGLHDVEGLLNATGASIVHLRPASFFENYLAQLDPIRQAGSVFMPVSGSVRLPMIATADIAEAAAKLVGDDSWSGKSVRGLHGPADLSFDEAAAAIGRALGREVKHVNVPVEQARAGMRQAGIGDSAVETMLELYRAIDQGTLEAAEPRSSETTTPTTIEDWARGELAPALG